MVDSAVRQVAMTFHKLNLDSARLKALREQAELFKSLRRLDAADEVELSSWECNFLESCLRLADRNQSMSDRQKTAAQQLLEKYGY